MCMQTIWFLLSAGVLILNTSEPTETTQFFPLVLCITHRHRAKDLEDRQRQRSCHSFHTQDCLFLALNAR